MTQQPAAGERYYYESIKSDALSLEDEYEVDFRGLMDAEYNKLCVEQKTCTVNCAMVREAWRRLMLDAPAALAAAAEQLRAVMEENEKLQADNSRLNEIIASYSRASILNREELKRANERLAAAEKTARLCHKHISCLKRDAQREYELYPTDYNCRYDWIELSDLLELIESMPPTPNPTEADRE